MKFKKLKFLLPAIILIITGCKNDPKKETVVDASNHVAISIDAFSEEPTEIDMCACYFAKDAAAFKKGNYIFVNDYAETSFMNINGKKVMFSQTDLENIDTNTIKTTAKSKDYKLTIKIINDENNDDETHFKSGTITLTGTDGQTVTTSFYGECGC